MIKNLLIVGVVGMALYVVLEPIPESIEIPWKLKVVTLMVKVSTYLTPLGSYLAPIIPGGFSSWIDCQFREAMRAGHGIPNVTYSDATFAGVPVRVFADRQEGENSAARPAVVFFHGGGWCLFSVDMFHPLTEEIAKNLDVVLVSVEYRLAPEHIFPAAVDDCTVATVHFLQHLADFNVDPGRVAIMGDSAGGNLAAAVAQRLTLDPKYRELPKLKMQVLIYPCLQAFDFQTPSYQQNGDYFTVIVDRVWMAEYWVVYLNNKPSLKTLMSVNQHTTASAKTSALVKKCLSHDLIPAEFKMRVGYKVPPVDYGDEKLYSELRDVLWNPDFAPLMREDLRGLPEAYILTAEYDVLRDDGIMYAKRLEKAGVKVTWKHYKKGFHGMFSTKDGPLTSPSGDLALEEFFEFARKNL